MAKLDELSREKKFAVYRVHLGDLYLGDVEGDASPYSAALQARGSLKGYGMWTKSCETLDKDGEWRVETHACIP